MIEQAKNVKQRAFAAAGRTDDRVHRSRLESERNAAQSMDAFLLLTEKALDVVATKTDFVRHTLDPRRVATGGSRPARRAGT